jgi:hypothetical protein
VEDLERYLNEIVEPTVDDFRQHPSSVRKGFLACVVIDHSVDYLAYPGDRSQWDGKEHRDRRARLRKQFREESEQFRLASEAANAVKHVKTTSKRGLEAGEVYERPPAIAGRMMAGVSMVGDATGAVVIDMVIVFSKSSPRPYVFYARRRGSFPMVSCSALFLQTETCPQPLWLSFVT